MAGPSGESESGADKLVSDEHEAATIKALAASQILKAALEDGAHSLTPSADFHAELDRLIAEATSKLGDE